MRALLLTLGLALAACGGADDRTAAPVVADEPVPGDEVAPEATPEEAPPADGRLVVGDDPCTTDEDCVPADCCHAAACVARERAPDCGEVMCTMECRSGTMDCGGGCLCHEGRCAARLTELEPPSVQ